MKIDELLGTAGSDPTPAIPGLDEAGGTAAAVPKKPRTNLTGTDEEEEGPAPPASE